MKTLSREPALNTGLSLGAVAAVWVLVNAFWPNLIPQNVQDALTEIALFLIPVITGWLIRSKVWSPASVKALQMQQLQAPLANGKKENSE